MGQLEEQTDGGKSAKILSDYKVKSVQCRAGVKPPVGDRPAVRGYLLSDMDDLFERYKSDLYPLYPENDPQPVTPPRVSDLFRAIKADCQRLGLKPPSYNTLHARLLSLDPTVVSPASSA